jgi:peroxisomal enoyl-CoA hydratase 2
MSNKRIEAGETNELTIEEVGRKDFVQYAGASGDFNPIHYDDTFAERAGYSGVFGQGMLVAGFTANLVTGWFEVDSLERFRVRFVEQVWPGDTINIKAEVTDVTERESERLVSLDLVAENDDDATLITGEATVQL